MYKKVLLSIAVISLSSSVLMAKPNKDNDDYEYSHKQQKEKKHKHKKPEKSWERKESSSIPYGLQKRSENTGKPLPPGWQKKLKPGAIMDREVYEHGRIVQPLDKDGLLTISVEGKLVRLYQDTREIIEILK
ncbi:hypothetical protein [Sulfurimonas sp. C5]|uniref:hypothetical protein n=1 Tax=Sulfurimonas sp. C5 TaxID=3036947 RepID=UPI0024589680|nr:hypothetical protein [Sulfurimonas sp. C5]MDH4945112.1 hypothetical protein [Sulfurimonas sp. C5]